MALPTLQTPTIGHAWPDQGQWTYSDWLRLPNDGFRYEIIDGELFVSPSLTIDHQNAASELLAVMRTYARRENLGLVLTAPVGVQLPNQEVVIQPDVLFVGRERLAIVHDDLIVGAPDLVVEILSPSNWVYDRTRKQKTYEQAGVREYWIVDYRARTVDVLVLEGHEFVQRGQYREGDVAPSEALPGFAIPVADIFAR